MKKLMLLGGSRYLIPVIKKAHEMGIYTITCDYLPDNIAHKYSDEYINVSVVDNEKVLKEAQRRHIDGIMSFACDPGVVTAAYVAEKLELPFQLSYESAKILQDKGLFREFLHKNGFNTPFAKRYTDEFEALNDVKLYHWPIIVKPVDSAGSKGVTKVDNPSLLSDAITIAKKSSRIGAFILEEFLTFLGYHSSTDPFSVDGKLEFITYSDQLFDMTADNPYTPAYIIWPSTMNTVFQDELSKEIQRLLLLLNASTGIYNVETCVASDGKAYIMEVSPRGGGCRIAEIQALALGADLIENEVRKAVGIPLIDINVIECDGYWCEMVVHAKPGESGVLKEIYVDDDIKDKYLQSVELAVKTGDKIYPFTGANMSLGDMFFRFDSREELDRVMKRSDEWLHIELV